MAQIDAFFKLMNDLGASDLHLAAGQKPVLRVHGELERVKYNVLDDDALRAMLYEIAPEPKPLKKQAMLILHMKYQIWPVTGLIFSDRKTVLPQSSEKYRKGS